MAVPEIVSTAVLPDHEIVERVRSGETALFEILMRRHNRRVYRVVRSVLRGESDVEDVMQQAYVNAFTHLHQFEERSQFSTWLTRIAIHEACGRRRKMRPECSEAGDSMDRRISPHADPEHQAYASELGRVLETAVDSLPDTYRTVFVLRDIEGLSTTETAVGLGLGEEAVKTRLHRARAMVRRTVTAQIGAAATGAFPFHAPRCDRVVTAVLTRIGGAAEYGALN